MNRLFFILELLRYLDVAKKIKVSALIDLFETMEEEHWEYEYGAASEGEVDCSGAFDYAAAQFGRPDVLHSSNRIARINCPTLLEISAAKPGYAAFRWRKDFETAELEEKYSDGLGNFKHMGLVSRDGKHVLHAKGEKYGFVCEKLDSSWQYVAALNFVDYSEEVQEIDLAVICKRKVVLNSGHLNLRAGPSSADRDIGDIPNGAIVEVLTDGEWPFIRYEKKCGYVLGTYLEAIPDENDMPSIVPNNGIIPDNAVVPNNSDSVSNNIPSNSNDTKITIIDSVGNHFEPVGDFRVLRGSID